nr:hypothetical protein CFP56_26876 [Quercus suber]
MPHNPNPERPKSTYASFTNNTNRSISIVCSSSKINGHHLLAWRAPTRHGNGLETACFEQSNKRDTRTLKLKGLGIPWKHRNSTWIHVTVLQMGFCYTGLYIGLVITWKGNKGKEPLTGSVFHLLGHLKGGGLKASGVVES